MSKGIDLSHIYSLRNNFTIIGLTGQIGSGCSEVAEQLSRGFRYSDFEDPLEVGLDRNTREIKHNSYRKYRIVYNYAKHKDNFKGYSRINYKDVLMIFILQNTYVDFKNFLISSELENELKGAKLHSDFSSEVLLLNGLKQQFEDLSVKYKSIKIQESKNELSEFYFNSEFHQFCDSIYTILKSQSQLKRNKFLQIVSTNLRKSGSPFVFSEPTADNIFTIVKLINQIIESHTKNSDGKRKERIQIVIDDLRSPIEIMYFKQQYAAFYTIAVTKDDKIRKNALKLKYNKTLDDFDIGKKMWEEEYEGGKNHEFYKAKISACIQQADIHISFLTKEEASKKNLEIQELNSLDKKNEDRTKDNTSPYFSWKMELLKYVSLISHPGLVTPTPEERCMQMAYTAKHNSGCISRHVGAAITDENYSVKAIGWNDTPAGQVPCALRITEELLENKNDIISFTDYEKKTSDFFNALDVNFRLQIKENREKLKGRNVCFCFKDVKNSCPSEGKNQVHTRSLHAEESAFLQIAKYGGVGIENGKLFTTASPCELCAKKAYQLGIKVIYYIDPYPGISDEHILSAGNKPIKPRLFSGVIGNAYHWLYDPIMPYKDELTLLLGNKFDDYASQQEKRAIKLKAQNEELQRKNEELQKENEKLKISKNENNT
jgi:deoxycytidylate deaminase